MVPVAAHGSEKGLYKTKKSSRSCATVPQEATRRGGRWLYVITLFSILFVLVVRYSFSTRQQDSKACGMSYMYPSYRHLHGFDHEHTRFASKYSLYLYRELTVDTSDEPQGVPVLFVPGNAGSYKQVRPIAAEAASQFYQSLRLDADILKRGKRNLDFFTVDFNEDFSAFHGQTMLDQAEYLNSAITYILSLYTDARKSPTFNSQPDPTSVIIIGHSMGGLVARLMQIMPNYLPKSINTIITMSTPHAIPPAPFDPKIQQIYEDINSFWFRSFQEESNKNALQDVSLISIAGGGLDTIVSSDYTSTKMIVPETNGFTVFTSTIPDVWISADHQAILWCDQFRKVIARALLECVDARRGSQTSTISKRMATFSKHFLSRLDTQSDSPTLANQKPSILLAEEPGLSIEYHRHTSSSFRRVRFSATSESVDLLPIKSSPDDVIQVLTNIMPGNIDDSSSLSLSLCRQEGARDWKSASEAIPDLSCIEVTKDLTVLPSQKDMTNAGSEQRLYYLQYNTTLLSGHEYLTIKSRSSRSNAFIAVEMMRAREAEIEISTNMLSLFFGGFRVVHGSSRSLVSSIFIRGLVSSLVAYKLHINSDSCPNQLMTSVTRQHLSSPYESKYYVGVPDMDISLHGQAPFFPTDLVHDGGLLISHWSDPFCEVPLDISLKVDYLGSLGKLVMRYRVVLVVYPLTVALLSLWIQLNTYHSSGSMVTFQQAMRTLVNKYLISILGLISVASFFLAERPRVLNWSTGIPFGHALASTPGTQYFMKQNDKLLGLQDTFLWWLAPLFIMISVGLLNLASLLLLVSVKILALIFDIFKGNSKIATEQAERSFLRRVLTTIILFAFVSFLVPYQFAYIVACMVQLATCIRLLRVTDTKNTIKAFNLSFGMLVLMLCALPINMPILIVWVRNISVQWLTPFSSHHNVMSVAPTILLVESMTNGMISPPVNSPLLKMLGLIMVLMACTSIIYGVMYTYMLHHILNILAGCLFLFQHCASYSASLPAQVVKQ